MKSACWICITGGRSCDDADGPREKPLAEPAQASPISMTALRIAFLLESTVLCGGVKVVCNLASKLAAKGHKVKVISSEPAPNWYQGQLDFVQQDPFALEDGNSFDAVIATSFRLALAYYQYIDAGKIWHLVQGFEGWLLECRHLLHDIDQAYKLQIPKITISKDLALRLTKLYPDNFFISIDQGIEKEFFYPPQDWSRKAEQKPVSLFLVGPWSIAVKQIELGLKAFRLVSKAFSELQLVRICTVDTKRQEQSIVGSINEYHVHIHPDQIGQLFRSKNGLLLAPSGPEEGFGLPPLEAMACAVPVVMSDIPSFTSFAQPVDYARFVRHDDPEDMAAGICELLTSREKRKYLAWRGLQVTARYSFERMAERLERVIFERPKTEDGRLRIEY